MPFTYMLNICPCLAANEITHTSLSSYLLQQLLLQEPWIEMAVIYSISY